MSLFEDNSITGSYPLTQTRENPTNTLLNKVGYNYETNTVIIPQQSDNEKLLKCINELNTFDSITGHNLVREKNDAEILSNTVLLLLLEPHLEGKPLLPPPAAERGGRSRRRRRKYSKRVRRTCKPNKKRTRRNKLKKK
jgi:hypothetical protein